MPPKIAIITVVAADCSEALAKTAASVAAQTIPCAHYWMVTGRRSELAVPRSGSVIDVPLDDSQSLLARGIGLQLAFNQGAEITACLEPGETVEPQCMEFVASELEKTAVDILELRHPEQRTETGKLFYPKRAAFLPTLWAQIHPVDAVFVTPIINQLIEMHGLCRRSIVAPLISKTEPPAKATRTIPFRMPLSDERFSRRLYQQTGLPFGRVQRTRARKVNSVAVITPYFKESLSKLWRCHESVISQGPNVRHFMIADGFPRAELNQWKLTHIGLPQAHTDNGNTPRGIGGMIAFAQGFDAVAYLDADNWFAKEHIASMRQTQHLTGASVVCSWRTIVLPDGTLVNGLDPEDQRKTHVDTSCYMITREVAFLAPLWAKMPQRLGPICDRIFLRSALEAETMISWTHKPTVLFESNYMLHYRMAHKTPETPVHDIPPNFRRNIDPVDFYERTGKTITLVKRQPVSGRAKKRTA